MPLDSVPTTPAATETVTPMVTPEGTTTPDGDRSADRPDGNRGTTHGDPGGDCRSASGPRDTVNGDAGGPTATEVPVLIPNPDRTTGGHVTANSRPERGDGGQGSAVTCPATASAHAATDVPGEAAPCDDQHDASAPLAITPTAASLSSEGSATGDADHEQETVADTGDIAPEATEPLDTEEMNVLTEASSTPQPASEAEVPAGGTKGQKRSDRGGDGQVDPGDGDLGDPTVLTDPVGPTRAEPSVDEVVPDGTEALHANEPTGVPEARGNAKQRRKAAAATVIAGDPERDETTQVDDGETTDHRGDVRGERAAGGTAEPHVRPTQEPASPASQDDGPARGKKGGRKATAKDDPRAGELAETPGDPALAPGDAPAPDGADPGADQGRKKRGPRGEQGRDVWHSSPTTAARATDSANDAVDRRGSRQSADPNKAYRIVTTRQSPHTGDAAVVVDGDPDDRLEHRAGRDPRGGLCGPRPGQVPLHRPRALAGGGRRAVGTDGR